jgi:hypothetical protein
MYGYSPSLLKILFFGVLTRQLQRAAVAYQIRFTGAKCVLCLAADRFFDRAGKKSLKMILRCFIVKFYVKDELVPPQGSIDRRHSMLT